jgi:hypothetical protein
VRFVSDNAVEFELFYGIEKRNHYQRLETAGGVMSQMRCRRVFSTSRSFTIPGGTSGGPSELPRAAFGTGPFGV